MRLSIFAVAIAASMAATATRSLQAQGARWSLGLHGGADVTDDHTLKLLGAQLGYGIARGTRIQVAVTTVIEEPGTMFFALAGGQWTPARWTIRPFIGGGLAMAYQEVGPFNETDFGWLAQGGFRLVFRNLTPFAEFRLIGFNGTASQILVGFESRAY
jgi:hypothetical protein